MSAATSKRTKTSTSAENAKLNARADRTDSNLMRKALRLEEILKNYPLPE
jgi:hypothetical protein